ncbi:MULTISPECIES: aspartyl-phosphate phosphatase Spo0E family protein [Bacillaceae]|uniref:aspartyl-phosphate phosphatase Spo0E family protein n=1 Tax=Bacillaceae TaxID=186817 RepID=UPI001E56D4BA|nr:MULTISPECIES: aspartyl-phosphate phosphatase Spo0E family protein [Bacillaceae]MCE4051316.1 aspartyl-phosphate phosphatase Spo0E family protein [Bacillus sp. Au-Bac7]MCM3032221.1 aspartyl-phosphate phosphatase Spo0E family protein [Niallia sp. MER 6]MDL0436704.1 aspartyl-phosphate phosphatase Spo0E family protein [Niallia sp. SS-2023]UPO86875.1 aspartyl-phosphate phosphatase Spo0E family protein [Niallia sp. Man26]
MSIHLNEQIEMLRENMISTGMAKGFTSKETILLSKRLDNLMNLQMMIHKGEAAS